MQECLKPGNFFGIVVEPESLGEGRFTGPDAILFQPPAEISISAGKWGWLRQTLCVSTTSLLDSFPESQPKPFRVCQLLHNTHHSFYLYYPLNPLKLYLKAKNAETMFKTKNSRIKQAKPLMWKLFLRVGSASDKERGTGKGITPFRHGFRLGVQGEGDHRGSVRALWLPQHSS